MRRTSLPVVLTVVVVVLGLSSGPAVGGPDPAARHSSPAGCAVSGLRLARGAPVSEMSQQSTHVFRVTNGTRQACMVDGYPTVTLTASTGRTLPFRYRDRGDQELTSTAPRPVVLAPGGHAFTAINKNACVSHDKGVAQRILLRPKGSKRRLGDGVGRTTPDIGYCAAGDPGHTVDVAPFVAHSKQVFSAS